MKFCNKFTWPLTSVSAVTPSHWISTSPSALWAAHSAPRRTCSQKSKPMALGTTASWTGAFSPWPPPPPWLPPPPPDSRTCAPQAATKATEAARNTARTCLLLINSSSSLYRRCMQRPYLLRCGGESSAAVLVPEDREPDHDADNHLLVEGVYVKKDRPVTDQGYEEGPDQGSH